MDLKRAPSSTFRGPDLEAQALSRGGSGSRASSYRTSDSHKPTSHRDPTESGERPLRPPPQGPGVVEDENSANDPTGAPGNMTQPKPGWKPWKPDGLYRTKIPESKTTMEDWVKTMDASDDGMCKGWREQIDTLVIFAGLFSATVTAFTVESYQWLDESPADMLARLQLRALLNATQDPAIDRLAPAMFNIKPASVAINTLWFASLTLALAAVVISILCKQWLYEYQRYDNFTTNESFLTHGLRYRGLQAWRVPDIIASLPILLQTALVLFLVGVLVLLWSLQTVVASIITVMVGLTLLFLIVTTVLPTIQYIYPKFDTQCAYKSSQSWTFFLFSSFWLFDFGMFTSWATFDQWEVNHVCSGTGRTLSRVYELLSNNVDAFQGICSILADTSLNPTINADLTLLSDFIDGLDVSRRNRIIKAISCATDPKNGLKWLQRPEQLKGCTNSYYTFRQRLKPTSKHWFRSSFYPTGLPDVDIDSRVYHLRIQETLSQFLRSDVHLHNSAIFNRCVEHWARCIVDANDNLEEGGQWKIGDDKWEDIFFPIVNAHTTHIQWDPDIAAHLVECILTCSRRINFLGLSYTVSPSYIQALWNATINTILTLRQLLCSRIYRSGSAGCLSQIFPPRSKMLDLFWFIWPTNIASLNLLNLIHQTWKNNT